jgi:ABC-2 type transport system permease protein
MMKTSRILNQHVIAVMENEWSQLVRNRVVVYTTTIPTVLLVALAVSVLILSRFMELDDGGLQKVAGGLLESVPGAGNLLFQGADKASATLLSPFLVLFQVIPLVVPITIASYSIVGEKQQRSLEPLLATPIKTWELLLAKAMSAAIPGMLSTWWGFAMFILAGRLLATDQVYSHLLLSPTWLLGIVLLAPTFTFCAVALGIIISSRVKDPNSAQQLGSLLILPVIALLVAQVSGMVEIDVTTILGIAFGVGLLDLFLIAVAVHLFRREEILTGWQ